MPLAAAAAPMDAQVQNIVGGLPQSEEALQSWNAAEKWANVAEAFFQQSVIPAWTPLGLSLGKQAFIGAALGVMSSPQAMSQQALEAGFTAFAALCASPGNVMPPIPVTHTPPAAPLNLSVLLALPPSESTMPSTTALHGVLLTWAITGLQTTPGAPPVVLPWS